MKWLFKSNSKDVPVTGSHWIVPAANVIAVSIVVLASMQARVSTHDVANAMPSPTIEVASLD